MSFLAPKQQPASPAPKPPAAEATVIRNPANKARARKSVGSVQSILTAGLAGQNAGATRLGGQ